MAYKQTPGRGNGKKTGGGLSPMLMGGSPMRQQTPKQKADLEKAAANERRVNKAVGSYSSNKKLNKAELGIEWAAANDSIEASDKAGDFYTKRKKAQIGNKAAEATRKINNSTTSVKKTEVLGKKGYEDKYERVKATPAKQMSKLKSSKSPAKQVSKMPAETMERNRGGRSLEKNGTREMPKASKKAPMKKKSC
jgi:hypothetical protein